LVAPNCFKRVEKVFRQTSWLEFLGRFQHFGQAFNLVYFQFVLQIYWNPLHHLIKGFISLELQSFVRLLGQTTLRLVSHHLLMLKMVQQMN